ncbi:MAG: hypothetical protein A2V62_04735 [Nitrospirae bacterium RBG_19FT_COMBO_58_9]|nr:MAG: hypothetical protein A2V62_04735 [Nitrospirae bacterium RBG_19FT_COMBO_58_9]
MLHSEEVGWRVAEQGASGDVEQAVQAILRHLVEHPEAKDTLEGIVRCWGEPLIRTAPAEVVRKGLDELTHRGWVSVRTVGTGMRLYGLNKDRLDDVKRYLHG